MRVIQASPRREESRLGWDGTLSFRYCACIVEIRMEGKYKQG